MVFLGFMFSIQELQYKDNLLRQFCNPSFDRDKIKVVCIRKGVEFGAICRDRGGGGAGRAIALPLFCLG